MNIEIHSCFSHRCSDSTLGRDLLSKLSSAQLVLQDFQGKLSDLLHLESALTALQDFNETSKTLLTTNSGINLLAKDVANHTKEKLEVTKETIVANYEEEGTSDGKWA